MEDNRSAKREIPQDVIDFLMLNIPVFSKLKGEELRVIEKHMKIIEVIPGDVVFEEGESGDKLYFVVEGSVDVLKKSENGDEILITTLSKGQPIGEMSIIDDHPRSATIRARTKATLLALSKERYDYILEKHSGIGVKVLKEITRLLSLNLRKTSSRVAKMLTIG